NSKQVKQSGTEIYLLYHSQNPSVMIECGFMSNAEDIKLLHDESFQKKLVFSIADGIINYLKESDVNGSEK
ncbi:MAG: N-acetylmuramoyl-L-alanine amidase, partial [Clostridia bacterium]|nr:N-acetylmuramoyl-L-alanine amidase [Clostridia bacterium]